MRWCRNTTIACRWRTASRWSAWSASASSVPWNSVSYPDKPPRRPMDLWRTADLVKFDPVTWFLTDVYEVERLCNVGKDKYRVRFRGVPGASNAQWQCGTSSGA